MHHTIPVAARLSRTPGNVRTDKHVWVERAFDVGFGKLGGYLNDRGQTVFHKLVKTTDIEGRKSTGEWHIQQENGRLLRDAGFVRGGVGKILRHDIQHKVGHTRPYQHQRQWITLESLEAGPSVTKVADAVPTIAKGNAVEPDPLPVEFPMLDLPNNSTFRFELQRIIVDNWTAGGGGEVR